MEARRGALCQVVAVHSEAPRVQLAARPMRPTGVA